MRGLQFQSNEHNNRNKGRKPRPLTPTLAPEYPGGGDGRRAIPPSHAGPTGLRFKVAGEGRRRRIGGSHGRGHDRSDALTPPRRPAPASAKARRWPSCSSGSSGATCSPFTRSPASNPSRGRLRPSRGAGRASGSSKRPARTATTSWRSSAAATPSGRRGAGSSRPTTASSSGRSGAVLAGAAAPPRLPGSDRPRGSNSSEGVPTTITSPLTSSLTPTPRVPVSRAGSPPPFTRCAPPPFPPTKTAGSPPAHSSSAPQTTRPTRSARPLQTR